VHRNEACRHPLLPLLSIPEQGLVGLPLGDPDVLEIGDYVVAIGNPPLALVRPSHLASSARSAATGLPSKATRTLSKQTPR
jgi:S1-C subfamily serine protease